MTDLTTIPDRQLADRLFWLDVKIAELYEIDAVYGDEDGPAADVLAVFAERDDLAAERDRRIEQGVAPIVDPTEPTLEERLAPYGIEWRLEQRDRQEGRS